MLLSPRRLPFRHSPDLVIKGLTAQIHRRVTFMQPMESPACAGGSNFVMYTTPMGRKRKARLHGGDGKRIEGDSESARGPR
ncbi:MAG: hypothetical protein MI923_16350 [Phycisphaerales bacterium]|nr:hypothetical protein [Phycisphaerales bacterium]